MASIKDEEVEECLIIFSSFNSILADLEVTPFLLIASNLLCLISLYFQGNVLAFFIYLKESSE